MPVIEITISTQLADKFSVATAYYNEKNETQLTQKQLVKKLTRQFTIDTIREMRVAEGHTVGDSEVDGL